MAAPGSTNVYSSSESDDSVATFTREPASVIVDPPDPPAGGVATRTVTLAAKSKVKKGKKAKFTGAISSSNVAGCAASQPIRLERKGKKDKDFKPLLTLTTNGAGAFSGSVKVKKKAQYRAAIDATATCGSATSPTKTVKAKKKKKRTKK